MASTPRVVVAFHVMLKMRENTAQKPCCWRGKVPPRHYGGAIPHARGPPVPTRSSMGPIGPRPIGDCSLAPASTANCERLTREANQRGKLLISAQQESCGWIDRMRDLNALFKKSVSVTRMPTCDCASSGDQLRTWPGASPSTHASTHKAA